MKRVHLVTVAALLCAAFLAYDASAGNYASPTSTEYFHVVMQPNTTVSWSGGGDKTILIDDVTFSGEICPPCPANLTCSFMELDDIYDPLPDPPQGPFLWPGGAVMPGMRQSIGIPDTAGINDWRQLDGSTARSLVTRCWSVTMELRDEVESSGAFTLIDQYAISGTSMIAVRRDTRIDSFMFAEIFEFDWGMAPDIRDWEIASGGGMGVGVGTGVGATGWQNSTSQSRHYQSPYIVQNDRIRFATAGGGASSSMTAIVRGRVVDSSQAPSVTSNVTSP